MELYQGNRGGGLGWEPTGWWFLTAMQLVELWTMVHSLTQGPLENSLIITTTCWEVLLSLFHR